VLKDESDFSLHFLSSMESSTMQRGSIRLAADTPQKTDAAPESPRYTPPVMYVIGRSSDLLQGCGRYHNDSDSARALTLGH
jgi:hypothetical protein